MSDEFKFSLGLGTVAAVIVGALVWVGVLVNAVPSKTVTFTFAPNGKFEAVNNGTKQTLTNLSIDGGSFSFRLVP